MNYTQLVEVSEQTGESNLQVQRVLDTALTVIKREVLSGEKVAIRSFGVFETRFVRARNRRSVDIGKLVKIPAHFVLKFRPSSLLRNQIAGRPDGIVVANPVMESLHV